MARMLRAHAARWQRETASYGYEVKAKLRARETRSWRRDWAEDNVQAEAKRHGLEWLRLSASGRRTLAFLEATAGPLSVWHS